MKFSIDSKVETSNNIPEKLITTAIAKSVGKHEAATFYLFSPSPPPPLPPSPHPWPNVEQNLIANIE